MTEQEFWFNFPHMFYDMSEGMPVTITDGVTMSMKRVLPGEHLFDKDTQFFIFAFKKEGYKQLEIVISSHITKDEKLIMPMYRTIARDAHTTLLQYFEDIQSGVAKTIDGDK